MPIIGSTPNKTFQRTDGTRTGAEVWQEAKTAAVKIRADAHDTHDEDIGDAISACLFKDGSNLNADIPMNTNKFTGVENAAARDQFAAMGQVQDSTSIYAATSSNDTITATLSPAITAYATGQMFLAKLGGTNTGAATLNYNTVGAKDIKKGKAGSLAMVAGDLTAGRMALFAYDGTNFQDLTAPEFPTGTKMIFWQTTPPTGWTKDTNHNDKALRISSGAASTGGTVAFETAFASQSVAGTIGGTAISIAQMPLHGHPMRIDEGTNNDTDSTGGIALSLDDSTNYAAFTGTPSATPGEQIGGTGGGATHDHTFTGTAINLDVMFVDVVLATKD